MASIQHTDLQTAAAKLPNLPEGIFKVPKITLFR